ncbi:MAG: hypothetical protein M1268_00955 [Patescibacteria group bacterium]|nr:hypothetical protein [Patescibacteria group bacterium]
MKFLLSLIGIQLKENKSRNALVDYKQAMLVKQGREQFKKLLDKGLSVPVMFL